MHFESPWAFLLLLLIPVLPLMRKWLTEKSGTLKFSSTRHASKAGRSIRQQLSGIPFMLRILALVCLIVALARPQIGGEQIRDVSKGVAIEMVIDRSSSMAAEMEYQGQRMNRLEVVKKVFKEFLMGNGDDLPGRPNDLVGMISFARYPDTICPLTLAHGALPPFLESVKLVQVREEDGTAIGDALALAAARLKTAGETIAKQREAKNSSYEIKSKIIILLSDGENNFGKRDPLQAAELAKQWGIKVYTIAIGSNEAVTSVQTAFGIYKMPIGHKIDTRALKDVAEKTGGFFRRAEDAGALKAVYEEIDKMEKSEIESVRFVDYKEAFLPFALACIVFMAFELLFNCTVFRKIP